MGRKRVKLVSFKRINPTTGERETVFLKVCYRQGFKPYNKRERNRFLFLSTYPPFEEFLKGDPLEEEDEE